MGQQAERPNGYAEVARQTLERSIGGLSDARLEPVVYRERPGSAIVREARDADLIVVGHRGDSRIALMLGSTANYVALLLDPWVSFGLGGRVGGCRARGGRGR